MSPGSKEALDALARRVSHVTATARILAAADHDDLGMAIEGIAAVLEGIQGDLDLLRGVSTP